MSRYEHHDTLKASYASITSDWNKATSTHRCGTCWLSRPLCYCNDFILPRQQHYKELFHSIYDLDVHDELPEIEFVLFYHGLELSRSANTAHVFEHLAAPITKKIIYGAVKDEEALFEQIVYEYEHRDVRCCATAVLYPSGNSLSMEHWITTNFGTKHSPHNHTQTESSSHKTTTTVPSKRPLIRLIVLDGTYARAHSMSKYFRAIQDFPIDLYRKPQSSPSSSSTKKSENQVYIYDLLPFVQLDLDPKKGIRSAIIGVMYQPALDKICSFQAIVVAMQQAFAHPLWSQHIVQSIQNPSQSSTLQIETNEICALFLQDLDRWIKHILASKIKAGKTTPRKSLIHIDQRPADFVHDLMVSSTVLYTSLLHLYILIDFVYHTTFDTI